MTTPSVNSACPLCGGPVEVEWIDVNSSVSPYDYQTPGTIRCLDDCQAVGQLTPRPVN